MDISLSPFVRHIFVLGAGASTDYGLPVWKDLMFDDIHSNTRGHKIIADRILPILEKVLREK